MELFENRICFSTLSRFIHRAFLEEAQNSTVTIPHNRSFFNNIFIYFNTFRYKLFKFSSLQNLLISYIQQKRATKCFTQFRQSILSNIAILCCTFNCECNFLQNRYFFYCHYTSTSPPSLLKNLRTFISQFLFFTKYLGLKNLVVKTSKNSSNNTKNIHPM